MKFLLDENFPKAAITLLEEHGCTVMDIRGTSLEGATDIELFGFAQEKSATLLTTDRDFFHTVPTLFERHCGVIVIALRQPRRASILSKLAWFLNHRELLPLDNKVIQLRDNTYLVRNSLNN